jgi:hypothetical protein
VGHGRREAKPIGDILQALVRSERRSGKIPGARLARDAIRTHFYPVWTNGVVAGRRSGSGHCIGREKNAPERLGPKEVSQNTARQVNPIGNETSREFITSKEPLNNVFVPMHFERATIPDVRGKACSGPNSFVNLSVIRVSVPE